ncbi:acyl-CoA dehydrogenase family protein [Rhabdothermincola salaria]|uniref:acyl-CoA dehydrogenase family protein n=1 Tax=Rhabdothermincola salaria TaxID=2903142 RepID=UPI001E381DFC|nr:acyl-CoA dehydrogenase family protein [Rhabdothermincola salaria]MCD9623626.1 acyl-CoA/acyl-ACP dehydrogenase [Rhabdothermincola salaria]
MDFSFGEEHEAVAQLAAQVFGGEVDLDRLKAAEAEGGRTDHDLWSTLAEAGLIGVGLADDVGGSGGDLICVCRLLEEQGRALAPVPLATTLVASAAIDRLGTPDQRARWLPGVVSGDRPLAVALDQPAGARWEHPQVTATRHGEVWQLDGWLPAVAAAAECRLLVVGAGIDGSPDSGLFLVDPSDPGVTIEAVVTTDRRPHGHVTLASAPAEPLGGLDTGDVTWLAQRLMLALSAVTLGVAEEALRRAAAYTSEREQFGRPLSSFQSTAHRAADAYIDVEAMRATLWQAAWLAEQPDPDPHEVATAVLTARWWAADGGQRVVHAVQHLHGGLGADVDYPVHRYFLWAKQLELTLGTPSSDLARLGEAIATGARATQEARR